MSDDEQQRPIINKEGSDDSTGASQDSDTESIKGDAANSDTLQRKEFLFSGSGGFIKYWNNLVIALALYNSMFIPL